MRPYASTATTVAFLLLAGASAGHPQDEPAASAEPMPFTRVHAAADGVSHFADAELAMAIEDLGPGMPSVPASAPVAVAGLRFFCFPDGTTVDWHPAPRRQLYVILSGELELDVADGEVRRFEPGSVLRGEATEGQGVRARWSGDERACVGLLPLGDGETSAGAGSTSGSVEERNKELARGFYEDLWFSGRTDHWDRYVADEYVVHDIGDRKNVTEPGIAQKETADFFHSQGEMSGSIDFQIAEGDLVATRWQWRFEPTSLLFRVLGGRSPLPIINVFRVRNGKIVEIWNHRHDIDYAWGNVRFATGLGIGLLLALPGWLTTVVLWRRGRRS